MEANTSIINHLSLGTNDLARATAFYDAVLAPLGARRVMAHPGTVAWGRAFPEFWIGRPYDDRDATVGNGTHVAFFADSPAQVDAFWRAALEAGASPDGAPGPRADYGPGYYGCFVRDLDGHKVEATYYDLTA